MSMYLKAAMQKIRFSTSKGNITVEDLFDLPLTSEKGDSLDKIAKSINRTVKDSQEESFVAPSTTTNTLASLMLDIVKDVIRIKLEENDAKRLAADRKAQKAQIMELIVSKKNEELAGKSLAELTEMFDKL